MYVAGVFVEDSDVEVLAALLMSAGFDETATKLALALELGTDLQSLTVDDLDAILSTLATPPDHLAELRDVVQRARV